MTHEIDRAADFAEEFWSKTLMDYRQRATELGITAEQAVDGMLSAAAGAKSAIAGPKEAARILYVLASAMFQAEEQRERHAAAASPAARH